MTVSWGELVTPLADVAAGWAGLGSCGLPQLQRRLGERHRRAAAMGHRVTYGDLMDQATHRIADASRLVATRPLPRHRGDPRRERRLPAARRHPILSVPSPNLQTNEWSLASGDYTAHELRSGEECCRTQAALRRHATPPTVHRGFDRLRPLRRASSSTQRRPGLRRSSTRSRRPARSTRTLTLVVAWAGRRGGRARASGRR
jgi:hypothetical protein